jgi:hypothetical protein
MLDREAKTAREKNTGKLVYVRASAARDRFVRNAGQSRSVVKSTNSHRFA